MYVRALRESTSPVPPSRPTSLPPSLSPYLNIACFVHEAHVAELLQLWGVVRGGIRDRHGGRSLREGGGEGGREGGTCQSVKLLDEDALG